MSISKLLPIALLVLFTGILKSQTSQHIPGTTCVSCPQPPAPKGGLPTPQNGNAALGTSYTNTACGLNYTSGSRKLGRRGSIAGAVQPAAITIAGIPNCATILRAFLYADASGNGIAINATIQNPAAATATFPMTMIGQDIDKCWSSAGYVRTHSYRADITSCITGNGNYNVSGLPVAPTAGNDVDGATILVIYADPTQNYTGSIVIADGAVVSVSTVITRTVTGFNACAASTFANGFVIAADLQGIANTNFKINSTTNNVVQSSANDSYWNFIQSNCPNVTNGQNSAVFGANNLSGDCFNIVAVGLYYRTACLTCTSPNNFSMTTTAAGCAANTVTASVTGGTAPYTYTWTGSAITGSVATGLAPGAYTVTAADATGCNTTTATFTVPTVASTMAVTGNLAICSGATTTLTASAGYSSYTWTPSTGLSSTTSSVVTASPASTTTYVVTGASGACTSSTSVILNVTPSPTLTLSSNTVICLGSSVNLTAGGATSYTWSPGTGLNTTSGTLVTASPTVTTTYTVTGSTGSCIDTKVVTVSVTSATVSVSSNTTICSGNSTTLTANGTTAYSWSPATGLSTTTGSVVIASPASTTTYVVTGSTGACTNTASVIVNVTPTPTLSLTADTTICTGSTANLTAGGATTYTWSPATGLNTTSGNQVAASPTITTTYTVTGLSGNCTDSKTVTVSVVSSTVTVSSNTIICNGNSTTLTANGSPAYAWSPATGLNTTSGNQVAASPSVTTTYTVMGGVGTCTSSAAVTVSVAPNPTVSVLSNTTMCMGSTTTLTASGASSYTWSPATGLSATTGSMVTSSPANTTTYTIIGATGTCTNSTLVTVSIITSPTITVSADTTICSGISRSLIAGGSSSYTWSPGTGLNNTTGVSVIASPMVTTTYTVAGGVGTCTNSAVVTITVITTPTISLSSNTLICDGSSATLNASGANTYVWTPAIGLNTATAATVTASPATTITYSVTGSISTCTASAAVTVTVIPNPVLSVSSNTDMCAGGSVPLNISGASSYTWSPAAGLTSTTGSQTTASPAATTIYSITGSNTVGPVTCTSATTVEVSIIPIANPVIDPVLPICAGDNVTLNATGGDTYKWTPATGLSNSTAATTGAHPSSTTLYTLTVTKAGFCTNTATIEVVVNPLPIIDAGRDTIVNIDEFITLNGTGNSTVGFLAPTGGTLSCNFCPSVSVNPQENTCYTLKGINQFGCVNYDDVCIIVTKNWDVYIPNSFTPNGDGINDVFIPSGYGLSEITLTIFDRWGHQIFKSNDTTTGWDGKLKGGLCEQGVYIYKAEIKTISGNTVDRTGHVTLLGKDL